MPELKSIVVVTISSGVLKKLHTNVPETMRPLGFSEVVFRTLADFSEKAKLAIAFRTSEPSASVRAFIDSAVTLGRPPANPFRYPDKQRGALAGNPG